MLEHTLGLAGLSHLITPAANHVEAMRHVTVTASSVVSQLQHMFEQYVQKTRQGAAEDAGGVVEALDRVAAVLRDASLSTAAASQVISAAARVCAAADSGIERVSGPVERGA